MDRFLHSWLAFGLAATALLASGCNRSPNPAAGADAESPNPPAASSPAPSSSSSVPSRCANEGWLTFAHDGRRTSASGGCVTGPLQQLWSFSPEKHRGVTSEVSHAIADSDAIYAVGKIGDSPAAWKIDWSGRELWRFDSRVDIQRGHWPTLGLGSLLVYDDGLYLLDVETGKNRKSRYLDAWGQSLTDGSRFYVVNTWHVDGPQVRVAALDREGSELWHRFPRGATREDVMDDTGALALDNDTLFYGADYKFGQKGALIAALNPHSGETRWVKPTRPTSAMSLGCGRTFGFERSDGKRELVARSQSDGERAWSAPLTQASPQAPVIAETTVVVEATTGLHAFECSSGHPLWRVEQGSGSLAQTPWATSLIAALGSGTLLLTRGRELQARRISDGSPIWSSSPAAARGALHSPVLVGNRLLVIEGKKLLALGE